jgi:protein SCO1/2
MELPEHTTRRGTLRRRALLTTGIAWAATAGLCAPATAGGGLGPVQPPLPVPSLPATLADGRRIDLRRWLPGKVTALQFMLTTCGSTCPLLGALFASAQEQLRQERRQDLQLLSVSVDVLGDSADRLGEWLKRFGAGPSWHAALPDANSSAALDALRKLGAGTGTDDQHEAGILLIDRRGRLVYRLDELPDARVLVRALVQIAQTASPPIA